MRHLSILLIFFTLLSCQKEEVFAQEQSIGEELMIPMRDGKKISASLLAGPKEKNPAIVIVVGSGEFTYRTYWIPKTFGIWKIIAESFVKKGYSVLLLEKRGINKSEGNWKRSTLYDRATDVLDAISFLGKRPDIIPESIGICGHSQGGWVAQIAAAQGPDLVDFIITLAGPGITVMDQVLQDYRSEWECEGLDKETIEKKLAKKRRSLNRLAGLSGAIKVNHLSRIIDYDPIEVLAKISCPTFAIFSENDGLVVPKPNIGALRNGFEKKDLLKITIIDSANHFFITSGKCTPWSELKPAFAPQFQEILDTWNFLDNLER